MVIRASRVRQGILASSRRPAKGVRGWKSLQGRLSWEKKTFEIVVIVPEDALGARGGGRG